MVSLYDHQVPLRPWRAREDVSERALARSAGISRGALRSAEAGAPNLRLGTLTAAASALGMRIQVVGARTDGASDCSTVAVAMKVCSDGFTSWKGHFMELVDEYRRTLDPKLLLLAPVESLDARLRALLAGIVFALSAESGIDTPEWARRPHFLARPWFVSESESLKASALLESPVAFRRNNIFVLAGFLDRA